MRRLCVSFSGGETSALMTWLALNTSFRVRYDEIAVVFANTGEEREETLGFVHKCDQHFGFGVVWVEAVIHHNQRKAPTARVVTFDTATRMNAEMGPFEQHIRKHGIPNAKFKDCTRNLKQVPIEAYLRDELGWGRDYDLAIGIRNDEIDRVSPRAAERRIVYPLVSDFPMSKPQVNDWWRQQPFRLNLRGYQGNCAWCWKKSMRKHITLIREDPSLYDFPRRMEALYPHVGPEFRKQPHEMSSPLAPGYRRAFFRGGKLVSEIEAESVARGENFVPSQDDHLDYEDFDLDVGGGCEETCEVFAEEDQID